MPHESLIAEYKIAFAAAAGGVAPVWHKPAEGSFTSCEDQTCRIEVAFWTLRVVPVLSSQKLKGDSSEVDLEERRHD